MIVDCISKFGIHQFFRYESSLQVVYFYILSFIITIRLTVFYDFCFFSMKHAHNSRKLFQHADLEIDVEVIRLPIVFCACRSNLCRRQVQLGLTQFNDGA